MEHNSRDFNGRTNCHTMIQFKGLTKNIEIARDLKGEQREGMLLLEFRESQSLVRQRQSPGCVAGEGHSLPELLPKAARKQGRSNPTSTSHWSNPTGSLLAKEPGGYS